MKKLFYDFKIKEKVDKNNKLKTKRIFEIPNNFKKLKRSNLQKLRK